MGRTVGFFFGGGGEKGGRVGWGYWGERVRNHMLIGQKFEHFCSRRLRFQLCGIKFDGQVFTNVWPCSLF